jgi:hypothetical protein
MKIQTPFSHEQITAVREWQRDPGVHPLTCGSTLCRSRFGVEEASLRCWGFGYTQNWVPDAG